MIRNSIELTPEWREIRIRKVVTVAQEGYHLTVQLGAKSGMIDIADIRLVTEPAQSAME
jgi:hypothetical protein